MFISIVAPETITTWFKFSFKNLSKDGARI